MQLLHFFQLKVSVDEFSYKLRGVQGHSELGVV